MSVIVIDTQPKRSSVPLDHGGRPMEEIADEYFSWMNPIGRKIVAEKRKCMDSHRRDWERLTQKEKDSILNEWFIDPKAQLRYELTLGTRTATVAKGFPRMKVEGGQKAVHYSEHDDASQTKETVSWKDEFSGPFSWETKCQQELTILTPEALSALSVPSPSMSCDLIKVSDPDVETDAEWFAKSNKDKNKLSVMLMRDVSNRSSFGINLLGSSTERLAFDQAVSAATAGKPVPKDKPSGGSGNEKGSGKESSLERRKKTKELTKPKMPPPVSAKQNNDSKDHDRKAGSGGKGRDKSSFPSSPRQNSGSRNTETASPRRNSGSKKKVPNGEKKQLLPAGFLTELEQELKVQDNVHFDPGRKEEEGQGDAKTQESAPVAGSTSFEFLFDW